MVQKSYLKVILTIILIKVSKIQLQDAVIDLKSDLFAAYDPQSMPVTNSTNRISICSGLYVLQIVDLDEKSQVMRANIQMLFIWVTLS
jgi:hypothetical protein